MERRLRLVVVGDGPLGGDLARRVADLGLSHLTWFTGDRSDVPELMRLFDLFVLPSLGEGVSNTLLEAMATGLAVIATRVGGNPELVAHGHSGTLVPVGRSDVLADALIAFLKDETLRRRCGALGREQVMERFNWDRCIDQYLDLYDGLLGRGPQAALLGVGGP